MNEELNTKIELADQLYAFQQTALYKHLIDPLHDEIAALKDAYDCTTLIEMATLKGKRGGLDKIFQIMYQIEVDAETARAHIKAEEDRALRNKPPEDSQDL